MSSKTLLLLALAAFAQADIYDNCGSNGQNCFAIPLFESDIPTCLAQKDCKVITSWQRQNDDSVKFQMEAQYAGVDDGGHWVALAFSLDGGRSMGDDAVIACYGTTAANYWNSFVPYLYSFPLDDAQVGLSDISVSVADGKIACSFTKTAVTTLELPNDLGTTVIDLNSNTYFIALATGPLADDGFIAPHQDQGVSDGPMKV